jgi:prenyltransferase beta subunit
MKSLSDRLLQSAACSRRFLEKNSLDKMARFILDRQNSDGGFRGRAAQSDLYYTVFAVASLKALGYPVPGLKVWKYIRSFGMGNDLDFVHLVCLVRLRTVFPIFGFTRRRLFKTLQQHKAESAYALFLKLFAADLQVAAEASEPPVRGSPFDPTTNLAAALLAGEPDGDGLVDVLLARAVDSGGFAPTDRIAEADLLSTATAVFALVSRGVNLDDIQKPCIEYAESLWRESGGFAGHAADEMEDVEYTFYALLTIGSLIQSMAKNYGA